MTGRRAFLLQAAALVAAPALVRAAAPAAFERGLLWRVNIEGAPPSYLY